MDSCTVVTGAAGGIGRAVAEKLLAVGEKVAAVDLEPARLEECYGGRVQVADDGDQGAFCRSEGICTCGGV